MLHEIIGERFFGKLRGEIKYYNSVFLIYCTLYQKCRIIIFNFLPNLPTKPFPFELFCMYMQYVVNAEL